MSGDVDTFAALVICASTFYVGGLATLVGAWYLEKLPPQPEESKWDKARLAIPGARFRKVVEATRENVSVSFRF